MRWLAIVILGELVFPGVVIADTVALSDAKLAYGGQLYFETSIEIDPSTREAVLILDLQNETQQPVCLLPHPRHAMRTLVVISSFAGERVFPSGRRHQPRHPLRLERGQAASVELRLNDFYEFEGNTSYRVFGAFAFSECDVLATPDRREYLAVFEAFRFDD